MKSKIQIYEQVKSLLNEYSKEDDKPKFLLIAPEKHGNVVAALAQHAFHGNDNAIMIGNIQAAVNASVVFTYTELEANFIDVVVNRLVKEKLIKTLNEDYPPELTVFDPEKDLYKGLFNPFKFLRDDGDIVDAKSVLGGNFKTFGEDHPAAIAGVTDMDAYYFYLHKINWKRIQTPTTPKSITGIKVKGSFEDLLLLEDGSLRLSSDSSPITKFQPNSDQFRLMYTLFTKQKNIANNGLSFQEVKKELQKLKKQSRDKHPDAVASFEDLRNKINQKLRDTNYKLYLSSTENIIRLVQK